MSLNFRARLISFIGTGSVSWYEEDILSVDLVELCTLLHCTLYSVQVLFGHFGFLSIGYTNDGRNRSLYKSIRIRFEEGMLIGDLNNQDANLLTGQQMDILFRIGLYDNDLKYLLNLLHNGDNVLKLTTYLEWYVQYSDTTFFTLNALVGHVDNDILVFLTRLIWGYDLQTTINEHINIIEMFQNFILIYSSDTVFGFVESFLSHDQYILKRGYCLLQHIETVVDLLHHSPSTWTFALERNNIILLVKDNTLIKRYNIFFTASNRFAVFYDYTSSIFNTIDELLDNYRLSLETGLR